MLWFHSSLWINRVSSYMYTFLNPYSEIHFLTIVNSPVMIIFSPHIFFPCILIYPLSCYFILYTNIFVQFFSFLLHLSSKTLYTVGFKLFPVILALLLTLASCIKKLWACGGIVLAYFFLCCVWRCLYSFFIQSPSFFTQLYLLSLYWVSLMVNFFMSACIFSTLFLQEGET